MREALKIIAAVAFFVLFFLVTFGVQPALAQGNDAQVRQKIIEQSIANYRGNCPCPYNTASNGSRCGGRSAYSRGGGYVPKCYPGDVTAADIAAYRAGNGG